MWLWNLFLKTELEFKVVILGTAATGLNIGEFTERNKDDVGTK